MIRSPHITSNFDGGSVKLVGMSPGQWCVQLKVVADAPHAGSPFCQWFYFRAGCLDVEREYSFVLDNAGECTFPGGWNGYKVYYSYDRTAWLCCERTEFDGKVLSWRLRPKQSSVYFSYYPPYSLEKLLDFEAECQCSRFCRLDVLLDATPDGHAVDLLVVGDPPPLLPTVMHPALLPSRIVAGPSPLEAARAVARAQRSALRSRGAKIQVWVLARQHPGETQGSWWIEGFLRRLLDVEDAVAKSLRAQCDFYVCPNVNPDGAVRGHCRSNANGIDLNREWATPTRERSPEVFAIEQLMFAVGVDLCIDVHSEENLPFCFVSKTMLGIPSLTDTQRELYKIYTETLAQASPEVALSEGYKMPQPAQANLGVCCAWVAEVFDCLAVTQEQPFKDNDAHKCSLRDGERGWSTERCRKLGAACLDAMLAVVRHGLRPKPELSPEAVLALLRSR